MKRIVFAMLSSIAVSVISMVSLAATSRLPRSSAINARHQAASPTVSPGMLSAESDAGLFPERGDDELQRPAIDLRGQPETLDGRHERGGVDNGAALVDHAKKTLVEHRLAGIGLG